ncbi:hypothetical protein Lalb_Chr15g0084411 [Lupinus albus]|uniref:Uncharacterized protein n=1 Tax=Lupinus albus TaxID=3870 RepID=A0A6A4PAC8_LUPAL|nr:hypothetical protein Lalb_Chr15g0084411 [Lupinus albus]
MKIISCHINKQYDRFENYNSPRRILFPTHFCINHKSHTQIIQLNIYTYIIEM